MTHPDFGTRYTLERELGRTPLGIASLVRDEAGETRVATRLATELTAEVHDRARMLTALRALVALEHPALVRVLDVVDMPDGAIVLVAEHVATPTADERLARGETLPGAVVAHAARAFADALEMAHAQDIRHGAISPALVHVEEGVARLAGTGVLDALVAGGAPAHRVVDMREARPYAAPEVARGIVDARTDVYALGTTLYAMLTGKPPFGGRTTTFVMAAVLADEPATTGGRRSTLADNTGETTRLTPALLRAVEKAPDDRWPTMAALVAALGTPMTPRAPVEVVEPIPSGFRPRQHWPRIALLVAFATIAFFLLCAQR